MKFIWFKCFDLRTALEMRLFNQRSHSFTNFCFYSYHGTGFNCGTCHLAITLCVVNITYKKPTTINEAWQQKRGALNHLLNIHIATVFSRWNCSQTFILMTALWPAYFRRACTRWFRRKCNASHRGQFGFTRKPFLNFRFSGHYAYRPHKCGHRNFHTRYLFRYRFKTILLPVCYERICKQIR